MPRYLIVRLNIGLETMKPVLSKCLRDHSPKASFHIALPVMRDQRIVPEITRAKTAAHNLVNIDNARQLSTFRADPVADMRRASQAFETFTKLAFRPRRICPSLMKLSTSSHGGQKLLSTPRRRFFKNRMLRHPVDHARLAGRRSIGEGSRLFLSP